MSDRVLVFIECLSIVLLSLSVVLLIIPTFGQCTNFLLAYSVFLGTLGFAYCMDKASKENK